MLLIRRPPSCTFVVRRPSLSTSLLRARRPFGQAFGEAAPSILVRRPDGDNVVLGTTSVWISRRGGSAVAVYRSPLWTGRSCGRTFVSGRPPYLSRRPHRQLMCLRTLSSLACRHPTCIVVFSPEQTTFRSRLWHALGQTGSRRLGLRGGCDRMPWVGMPTFGLNCRNSGRI